MANHQLALNACKLRIVSSASDLHFKIQGAIQPPIALRQCAVSQQESTSRP